MTRRQERELSLKLLYALEYNAEPWTIILERMEQEQQKHATEFVKNMVTLYVNDKTEIDHEIKQKLENWDFSRIAVIDKIIMRMATIELLHFEEIPPQVSINEAIELAKLYSTEKSGKFINGLLDAVYRDLMKNNRILKKGRGLVPSLDA